jgi:hypothetical protein
MLMRFALPLRVIRNKAAAARVALLTSSTVSPIRMRCRLLVVDKQPFFIFLVTEQKDA